MSTDSATHDENESGEIDLGTGRFQTTLGRATAVVGSTGYIAVLDVLGFKALVASDINNTGVIRYLQIIETALDNTAIQTIVFSDSIILALHGTEPEHLRALCEACSNLMYALLTHEIPVRGAISYGPFATSNIGGSAFIAGKPIIDAYEFEQKQDWIGIMLTPTAIKHCGIVQEVCTTEFRNDVAFANLAQYMEWKAYLQHCQSQLHGRARERYLVRRCAARIQSARPPPPAQDLPRHALR